MVKQQKSQDNGAIGNEGEGNYLIELLEKARNRHNINSWEEFAALVTIRSGDQVSGNTFRRNIRKKGAWKSLSLSLLQWAAIAEVTGVSVTELIRRFKSTNARSVLTKEIMANKIKIAIATHDDKTKLLGIDLEKISCFVYDGGNLELWMDGAVEALCIEKSKIAPNAFSQLLDALENKFPELYGEEFLDDHDQSDDLPY